MYAALAAGGAYFSAFNSTQDDLIRPSLGKSLAGMARKSLGHSRSIHKQPDYTLVPVHPLCSGLK
jgi:hypothetical protein